MHAVVSGTGHILRCGPTLRKIQGREDPVGQRFTEVFEIRRPRIGPSMAVLRAASGSRLHLRMRSPPQIDLTAVLIALPKDGGPLSGGALVDLSFGISVIDAVRDFALTGSDFAVTDPTIEMLYLFEAKSAAMEASRKLNLRLQGAMIAAEEQAFTDTLTGLKNRRAMDHVLTRLIDRGEDFALMSLDLDYFKAVNDSLGHAAGDHVLQQVARRIVGQTRGADTIARVGGDEFVVILAGHAEGPVLVDIAERVIGCLEAPIPFEGEECRVSASIGAVLSRDYAQPEMDQLLADADRALYTAKMQGRRRVALFDPVQDAEGVPPPATPHQQGPDAKAPDRR
jgi:diguanylate cyclase (GGDEF)-like protein